MLKMAAVRDTYPPSDGANWRVLDIGSMSYLDHDSYRALFSDGPYEYLGLDIAPGPNVDIVPTDPYSWNELATESFDLVISGQSLEHNPYFWITFAEIARVLRVGGLTAIIAPSAGREHRCPFDCWRFYPDSWTALCAFVGLEPVEHYVETEGLKIVDGLEWRDSLMVAHKPARAPDAEADAFYDRLRQIVATRVPMPADHGNELRGPAIEAYESRVRSGLGGVLYSRSRSVPRRALIRTLEVVAPSTLRWAREQRRTTSSTD